MVVEGRRGLAQLAGDGDDNRGEKLDLRFIKDKNLLLRIYICY